MIRTRFFLRSEGHDRPGPMDGSRTGTKAGQELHNDYVITAGPEFGSLRSFFRAAVRALVCAYIDYPHPGSKG